MFSVTHCAGGVKIIEDDNDVIVWIDIYGDLQNLDSLEQSKKDSVLSFLDENHITYNKTL